jgi:hypothetical protein
MLKRFTNMTVNKMIVRVICSFIWAMICALPCLAQEGKEQELAYSPETMKRLRFIVDSMHIKYRKCDLQKKYLSLPQTWGYAIRAKENIEELKKDLDAKMPLKKLLAKYPNAINATPKLIVKHVYTNYKGEQEVSYELISIKSEGYRITKDITWKDKKIKNQAVFQYYDRKDYKSLSGFYIEKDFAMQEIPQDYAKHILYADCMVDTTAKVILNSKGGRFEEDFKEGSMLMEFEKLILGASKEFSEKNPFPQGFEETAEKYKDNEVMPTAKDMEALWQAQQNIDETRKQLRQGEQNYIHNKIKSIPNFEQYLKELVATAVRENQSSEMIEEYLAPYLSPAQMLELKRRRQVVGSCSMDNSPREHALEIAKLSAETAKWEIFLRSHLDVLNDRFSRVSDGSYAWEGRATYFAELEALDIEALELLLGITLRAENSANGHYYGSVDRVGKALAETSDNGAVETKLLKMIADKKLDTYNRVLLYFTFLHYNHRLKNVERKAQNKEKLKATLEKLEEPLFEYVDWEKK